MGGANLFWCDLEVEGCRRICETELWEDYWHEESKGDESRRGNCIVLFI